jgi:hypothetical protein
MAFLTTQEIYLLKALMAYIENYSPPRDLDLNSDIALSPAQQNKTGLTSSSVKLDALIQSKLTAKDLEGVLSREQLLHKRIHDIQKFLEGPELEVVTQNPVKKFFLSMIPKSFLIRLRGRNQEFYENFVNDVKSVMDTEKRDIINKYYNPEKTDPKECLDPQTKIHEFSGFDYDKDVKTNPGLQMYAILNDFRKPGMMSKMFNRLPGGAGGLVFLKKIFQPNIIRDLVFLAAFIGVMATFGYIIAGLAIGVSFGAVIASSGAISMFSMAPIGAYFTGACAFDYFRKESHTPSPPVKMEGAEKNIKEKSSNTAPGTGPGHGFHHAKKPVSTLPAVSGHSVLDSPSRSSGNSSPRPSTTDID